MISVSSLEKGHGGRTLFRDVSFRLLPGRRIALVGGNGVGKTAILEIVVGHQRADAGEVHRTKDLTVGYLPQDLTDEVNDTVLALSLIHISEPTRLLSIHRMPSSA